jgi:hypothetical protein
MRHMCGCLPSKGNLLDAEFCSQNTVAMGICFPTKGGYFLESMSNRAHEILHIVLNTPVFFLKKKYFGVFCWGLVHISRVFVSTRYMNILQLV